MEFLLKQLLVTFGFFLAIVLVAKLLREHRPPGNTMAWVLAILLIPYVGVPLYILFGGRKVKRLEGHREPLMLEVPDQRPFRSDTEKILCSTGIPRSQPGNRIQMLPSGEEAFTALVNLIENAKESLYIGTFILGNDEVGKEIVERLAKKAKEGVKVRLLLDALGSLRTSRSFVEPVRKAGGKVGVFLPMLPFRRKWSANLRNHRKLWIADEKTAIVGGRNIAHEYMGPLPDKSRWDDFNLQIEGEAVSDLIEVFTSDWEFATKEGLPRKEVTPAQNMPVGESVVQVVASGPDTTANSLYQGLLTAILSARKRVWLVTPYFVPDEILIEALHLAARLGADVRIILPEKSNHTLADLARGSYLRGLGISGVRAFAYQKGMMHTKLVVIDDTLAVVGSANADMRSMHLNFEIGAFLYSKPEIEQVAARTQELINESVPLSFPKGTWFDSGRVWCEDISRLFAPLL